MFCINCGCDISETDKVCPNCGHIIGLSAEAHGYQVNENQPATLEQRVRAFVSDMCIMLLALVLLSVLLWGLAIYVWPFIVIAYFTFTVSGLHSATWGMASKGIKVVNAKDGGRVGTLTALLRAVLTIVFAVTFLFLIRNKEGRRLNDILSGTAVISLV